MSVKMNFGNLKYAIGSSRAIKLSKSRGPSSNNENSSTINLSTRSNVENILSKKNLQLKAKNEKSEKYLDANIASIKTIPIASKNSKHINKIQFISQSDRYKIKENEKDKEMLINLNSNTNFLSNLNTNTLPKKSEEIILNKSKHQKTSSEIPRNIAMNNYIYDNFHSQKNPREVSSKKNEPSNFMTNTNTNRNKFLFVNDVYNNTTSTINKENYDRAELDLNINMNITNHSKLGKNVFKSVERKNEKQSSKIVNSERNERKFLLMNVIDPKNEEDKLKKLNISKENLMKNCGDEKKNPDVNGKMNFNSFTKSEANLNNPQLNHNFNMNEQILMNRELIKTVEILNAYIKTTHKLTENKKQEDDEKFKQKDEEIKKLKEENSAIKKQNYELKMKMLQFLNQVKIYEAIEIQRETNVDKYISQIMKENEYLRSSNEKVVSLHLANNNSIPNKYNQDREEKDKIFNKITHKRQKTQINFTNSTINAAADIDLNKDKGINNQTITKDNYSSINSSKSGESGMLNTSSTSIISNKKEENDAFSSAILEMHMNQTIKKASTEDKKQDGPPVFILSPSAGNQKHKPSYLFYRTPGNKEQKKIEFN